MKKYAPLLGLASHGSKDFRNLWSQIRSAYLAHPESPVIINDHEVKCAELRNGNGMPTFYLHESELEWFRANMDKPIASTTSIDSAPEASRPNYMQGMEGVRLIPQEAISNIKMVVL